LSALGIEYDAQKAKKVVSELAGKNLEALIAEGSKKLATMPSGGGGGAAAPAAAAGAPAAAAKEEKKVESEKEESDDDMGFGLFD
jgi:large subunit ribosomal protein LP2